MAKNDITKMTVEVGYTTKTKGRKAIAHGKFTINLQKWIKMLPEEQDKFVQSKVKETREVVHYDVIN